MPVNSRQFNQFPFDENIGAQSKQALDWMVLAINQLLGQGQAQSGQGIQALQVNTVDPKTGAVITGGSRTSSITTAITFTSTTTSISFFWDGTNASLPFQIYRDDGSITGPVIAGSGKTVSGLTANTLYYFYAYWDEALQAIEFVSIPNVSVGTPPIAFTAQNILALQQQWLRNRIALAQAFASTGITTPASGTGGGSGGSGGGGGGGGGGHQLP